MKVLYFIFLCAVTFLFDAKAQSKYEQSTLLGYAEDSRCNLYIDDSGNAYAVINSRYDINFHGQLFPRHASGDYSVIGKFDSSGQLLWSRTISTTANPGSNPVDIIYDLKVDAEQNIYISGAGGGITLDDGTVLAVGTFLIKFDGKGKTLWGLISENTQNMTSMTGGPIALAKDGVYWSSIFYGQLKLQGRVLNTTNPNSGTPNAFVAKVNATGQVTSIYHDQSKASIPQIMVAADNGNASVIMARGGLPRFRVTLDENCNALSDLPFFSYGDFPQPVRKVNSGYEMFTNMYAQNANGVYGVGFYNVKFDNNLNITDSVKLFPNKFNDRMIYDAIGNNTGGYYLYSPTEPFGLQFDWILMSKEFDQTLLKPELRSVSQMDPFTRNFVKMSADTLNMVMRHLDYYTTSFVFNQQSYTTPSNLHHSYFWTKYLYEDPDSCKKVKVTLLQNGKEGVQNVVVKFQLPSTCPASEDLIMDIALKDPAGNDGDLLLPSTITIKKGETESLFTIPVVNDNYIEDTENFTINITLRPTTAEYIAPANTAFKIDDDDNTPANKVFTITYTPEITEGGTAGKVTVSLPKNVWLKQALHFSFVKNATAHEATENDYGPLDIFIPPGKDEVTIGVSAFADNLIEGDEYILGRLVENESNFGPFTSISNLLNIKIIDVDNTEANRLIDVQVPGNNIPENDKIDALLKLTGPYKLQSPISVTVTPIIWFPFLQQSTSKLVIDDAGANNKLTITYPDDHVIRTNKTLTLSFSASDSYLGNFKFRQSDGTITDKLELTAVDDDFSKARLQLQPSALIIKEGSTDNISLKLPEDYVMESSTTINYEWLGLEIAEDKRLGPITNTTILPAFQNSLQMPVKIFDDDKINVSNSRQIVYSGHNIDFNDLSFNVSDKVDIQITDDEIGTITVPNAFTPNADGINDTWQIKGLIEGANVTISVWNRYGSLVYQQLKYAPWDGTYKGSVVQTGTYYYTIASQGKTMAAGSVVIVR